MQEYFDFSLEPGKELKKIEYKKANSKIGVIMPYYNEKDFVEQAVISVLNQTYPYFELLIIDDGSNDKESVDKLDEIEKLDSRIKVFHKKNGGLSETRDYGVSKVSEDTEYIMFVDSDDVIEPTFLECALWTLETHEDASWAYSDSVGFGTKEYTWNKWFDSEKIKKINDLLTTSLVRKSAFDKVNGYELREKGINEDWNFWLKLISKGMYPVHMSYYGIWYRRKEHGEYQRAIENRKRALEIVENTAKKIKGKVEAIQYPKQDYNYDDIAESVDSIDIPVIEKDNKKNLLIIFPWMVTGGADLFNLDFVKGLDKDKYNITVITTECGINTLRQEFEKYATVYDLSSFLDQKYWFAFINYIMQKNRIDLVFNSNSEIGYAFLPLIKAKYPKVPIIDYVHMEEWYNRNGGYSRDSSSVESVIDKTLTCNENSRKILIDYFKREPEETQTVYVGVDSEKFDPEKYDSKQLREKYKIPENKKVISYICRITEQKRPFLLLDIVSKIKYKVKDLLFVVAGDGNLLEKMKEKAEKLNLKDCILFLGQIKDTGEIYSISDITLNCSIKEGLALTSYESLSMGVPVISSDVGGQKELINDEVGIIVPCMQNEEDIYNFNYSDEEINQYVKAIEKILEDLDKYKEKCRERILNEFTIDKMVDNMNKIVDEVLLMPNVQKIRNGEGLSNQCSLCKNIISKTFLTNKVKYEWQCQEFHNYFGYTLIKGNYKLAIFREKMWKIPIYRGLYKALEKIGVTKLIKKILRRQ